MIADYHRQIEAARAVGLTMTRTQAEAFVRLLESYAEDLATRVAAGLATRGERYALQVAQEIIDQLVRDMAVVTRNGVTVTANRVATIYAEATARLLTTTGPAGGGGVAILGGIGVSAAQAVLARPELAASLKTIRRTSIAAVDGILARSLLRGATSTQRAQELRLHILGADAFPDSALLDRRRIGYDVLRQMGYDPTPANLRIVRGHAGAIAKKAQLISRTEPMNAEWEAHRQGALESPVVAAIQWELSSAHPEPDECDLLQDTDFYGLGPGRYPVEVLPRRPHPRCLCRHRDVLRDPEEWDLPKPPVPARRLDPDDVARAAGFSPSRSRSLTRSMNASSATPALSGGSGSPAKKAPKSTAATVRKAIEKREAEIFAEPVEWATLFDSKTGSILIDKTDNDRSAVGFTNAQVALFPNNILTHNHPSSSSFSKMDLALTLATNLQELRVASRLFTYRLIRPPGGWPSAAELGAKATVANRGVEQELWKQINAGTMTPAQASVEHNHRVWRRTFDELGIPSSYTRTVRE